MHKRILVFYFTFFIDKNLFIYVITYLVMEYNAVLYFLLDGLYNLSHCRSVCKVKIKK